MDMHYSRRNPNGVYEKRWTKSCFSRLIYFTRTSFVLYWIRKKTISKFWKLSQIFTPQKYWHYMNKFLDMIMMIFKPHQCLTFYLFYRIPFFDGNPRPFSYCILHGPLTRYAKLRVPHTPGMPGAFSPPPRVSDPDMHHGTCVTPGSLTSGFLWSRWRGKRSRHSRRMRNTQIWVSG